MRRSLALVALALSLPACKKSPEQAQAQEQARAEQLCDAMSDLSLLYVASILELEVESLEPSGTRETLKAACKGLPPDLAECAQRLALDDPKCDEALAKHLGMTDTTPQGSGPAPSWALEAPFEIYDLAVAANGHVALAGEKGLGVVVDGAVKWKVELEDTNARVGWWKDCALIGVGGELRCYDGAGAVAWTTRVAQEDGVWLTAIEAGPEGLVTVVASNGAIVRIDGDQCVAAAKECMMPLATVEPLGGTTIEVLPAGAILGSSETGVVLVSATGTLLARKEADFAAGVPQAGLVAVKNDVLRANPACQPSADDCFTVVATNPDMELTAPVEVAGAGLAHADSYGVIHMVGPTPWKIDAGNDGDLVSDGTTLYSVGHQLGLGDALEAPPQLRAIDPKTGRTRWITKLGTERAGLLSGYIIALHGERLLVATKTHLFAVPLGGG
jgi:hypothetical protein